MFDSDKIQASVAAAVAAILLTAATVGAAVGPARAVETDRVLIAQASNAEAARG